MDLKNVFTRFFPRIVLLAAVVAAGLSLVAATFWVAGSMFTPAQAAPIPPPAGYPKLLTSVKSVWPPVVGVGQETLTYTIEIRNTGAYAASGVTLEDPIPANTTYNGGATASAGPAPTFSAGKLAWTGDVGFDSTVVVRFSVKVALGFSGAITNTAVIRHPQITRPVTVTAVADVTNQPIFKIEKRSSPAKPGPNKPLTYFLKVTNRGQPAVNLPIKVTDPVPANTTVSSLGPGAVTNGTVVTWTRNVSLNYGQSETFTFTVMVGDVADGAVISNQLYKVSSAQSTTTVGKPYTVTIIDPKFSLWKTHFPDPPGSNRPLTYTLTVFNQGSLATSLVITDRVPAGVTYQAGGTYSGGVVKWTLPSLDTGQTASFSYRVLVGDIAEVPIVNNSYRVCSAEGVCQAGQVITSVVKGPTFAVFVDLDPIAKKPGGGGGPVTPTLTLRNLGPGNAINAQATMFFQRIGVSANDLYAIPATGTPPPFPSGPVCGSNCVSYRWIGSLNVGQQVKFTTIDGQNSIGGEEGTGYTATLVVSDVLGAFVTAPITGTASGRVTHLANLIPTKEAPATVGRGELMTYTIKVWNSGLSTSVPPAPVLSETLPLNVSLVSISDGGITQTVGGRKVIFWTLPSLGPGDEILRRFTVRVNNNLISGTQLVNDLYRARWFETTTVYSKTGEPVTTTVIETGLIASFKEVTPQTLLPGPDNRLTYRLRIVNNGSLPLSGVKVYDTLPWQNSTYQRDAVASAGTVVSDIVSLLWTGNLAPFSSRVVTFTVKVDPFYQGTITNTATITHPHLLQPVNLKALAYITTRPVLQISKSASPSPVLKNNELEYQVTIRNLGQQATGLVVTDTLPANVTFVTNSGSPGVQHNAGKVTMQIPVIKTGESFTFKFRVKVISGREVINANYRVACVEGVQATGSPVITRVTGEMWIFLPIIRKK